MVERETSAAIETAATLWAVRADAAALSQDDETALETWLSGDVRRLGAYARAQAMLAQARRVKALGPDFDPNGFETGAGVGVGLEHDLDVAPRISRRTLLGGGAAVAAGAAAAIALSWPAAATTYYTNRGEIRLIPLADGSSMTLDTQSTARVLFTASERHVELVEGTALFDIARDARRAFVVDAAGLRVTGIATSFTMSRLAEETVVVTVRQGSVQLSGHTPRRTVVVPANVRASTVAGSDHIDTVPLTPSEMSRDIAWQQGMLGFEDASLSEAAARFARYSDVVIRFDDPSIGRETVTGLFAANDPQGFAQSAALSLGLRSHAQPNAVLLSRK